MIQFRSLFWLLALVLSWSGFSSAALAQEAATVSGKSEAEVGPPEEDKDEKAPPVRLSLALTSDLQRTFAGGLDRRNRWIGNMQAGLEANLEQLMSITSTSFVLEGFVIRGSRPSLSVGDIQLTSNLDSPNAAKLYQAFFEKSFFDERIALAVGVHDMNSDFYWQDLAGDLFMNSSFGLGSELAMSGALGPSTFPNTSLGVRLKTLPTTWSYFSIGAYDGVPGDAEQLSRTDLKLSQDDGAFFVSELGLNYGENTTAGRIGLGSWTYTQKMDSFQETDNDGTAIKHRSFGAYLLAEQKIWSRGSTGSDGLSAFTRVGFANPKVNPVLYNASAGVVFQGILPEKFRDKIGLGVTVAGISRRYAEAEASANAPEAPEEDVTEVAALEVVDSEELAATATSVSPNVETLAGVNPNVLSSTETTIELTYSVSVMPWLTLQPDFQYIFNPGFAAQARRASVGGIRVLAEF